MRHFLLLLLCFVTLFSQAQDQEKLNKTLSEIQQKRNIQGFSVACVDADKVLYSNGFGNAGNLQHYTNTTVQNIGSISKTFIGIALLKAQELGKLNIEDPINQYLPFAVVHPEFPNDPITIKQLATHTSGIKDNAYYEKRSYVLLQESNANYKVNGNFIASKKAVSMQEFLFAVLHKDGKWFTKSSFTKKAPGTHFEYSNVAAALCAYVIEQATATDFSTFTQTHIFNPLNLKSTAWHASATLAKNRSINFNNKGKQIAPYRLVTYPDGGLITSSNDLGLYLNELIKGYNGNGTLLSKESYALFYKSQLNESHFDKRNEHAFNDEYNIGIFMGQSAKGYIGHSGGDPGVATFLFFDPKTKKGMLLLTNTDLNKDGTEDFIAIWKALLQYQGISF